MKGKFITFEGSEGCGKSTQSKMLYDDLKEQGLPVVYLREPGGVKISEKIRDILLDAKNDLMSPACEMLLYMAARAQVVAEIIEPALKKGKIVIADRFLDSTICYQGFGLGMDVKEIKYVGAIATHKIKPNLTIFLDLPIEKGLKHRELTKDRIEQRSLEYHARVRSGYLALAKQEPHRIKIVKVALNKETTQEIIRKIVLNLITNDKAQNSK